MIFFNFSKKTRLWFIIFYKDKWSLIQFDKWCLIDLISYYLSFCSFTLAQKLPNVVSLAVEVRVTYSKVAEHFAVLVSRLHSDFGVTENQEKFVVNHAVNGFGVLFVLPRVVGEVVQTIAFKVGQRDNECFLSHESGLGVFSGVVPCHQSIFSLQNEDEVRLPVNSFMKRHFVVFFRFIDQISLLYLFFHMVFYRLNQKVLFYFFML